MVFDVTNSSVMFGTQLSSFQSTNVLSHFSDFFLVLLAVLFLWFLLTVIVALVLARKGRKKGQILWVFIISLVILLIILGIVFMNIDKALLMLGGV